MALGVPLFSQSKGSPPKTTSPQLRAVQGPNPGEQYSQSTGGLTPTFINNYTTRTQPWNQTTLLGRPSTTQQGPRQDPVEAYAEYLRGLYGAAAAPMLADLETQKLELQKRQSGLDAAFAARAGAAGGGASIANRGVDLDEEKLRLERSGTERQIPFLDQLLGLRSGQRGSERDYLKSLEGLSDRELALKLFGADAQQEFGLASADLAQKTMTRKQRSEATASGAVVTQGNRDALGDIDTEHATTTKKVRSDRELAGKTAQLERARDAAGIKARWDDNYWAGEIDKANTAEEKAKITDRLSMLDITAKELGLRREQIANSLSQTLASLGLDQILSIGQLQDAMDGNDRKAAEAAWEIYKMGIDGAHKMAAAGML